MEKIIKNRKLILIFLTIIIILISFSFYIKTTEIEFDSIINSTSKNKSTNKELLYNNDKKLEAEKLEQVDLQNSLTKNEDNKKTNSKKGTEIENIALIKDIKDPFKTEIKKENKTQKISEKNSEFDKSKHNNEDLIFLEKNIIADNLLNKSQQNPNSNLSNTKSNKNKSAAETTNKNKASSRRQQLKDISLPFKLLGITINKDNSNALFLYRGQKLLKQEKEKIDNFKIEKINNKNLTISYQEEERTIYLWKELNNEN